MREPCNNADALAAARGIVIALPLGIALWAALLLALILPA